MITSVIKQWSVEKRIENNLWKYSDRWSPSHIIIQDPIFQLVEDSKDTSPTLPLGVRDTSPTLPLRVTGTSLQCTSLYYTSISKRGRLFPWTIQLARASSPQEPKQQKSNAPQRYRRSMPFVRLKQLQHPHVYHGVSRKLRPLGLLRPKTPWKVLGVLAFETPHGPTGGQAFRTQIGLTSYPPIHMSVMVIFDNQGRTLLHCYRSLINKTQWMFEQN